MLSVLSKNFSQFLQGRSVSSVIVPACANHGWANWRMAKDVRKRRALAENSVNKLRLNAMRKNAILPKEIKDVATEELLKLPNDALGVKIKPRCAFTSRPRGTVLKWRVSRIVFRDLADHNLLAGIQRAMW